MRLLQSTRPTLTLAAVLVASTPGARAAETTLTYTGAVSVVHAATVGPQGPADIQLGTPVSFSVDVATTPPQQEHVTRGKAEHGR